MNVEVETKMFVLNQLTDDSITVNQYDFGEHIYLVEFDTLCHSALISIREKTSNDKFYKRKGKVALLNLADKKIDWTLECNYLDEQIFIKNGKVYKSNTLYTAQLDLESDEENWRAHNSLTYIDYELNIAIGYMPANAYAWSSKQRNKLIAINLEDGRELWNRQINRDFGWSEFLHVRDSKLLISGSGLHLIDRRTGDGWDYNQITGMDGKSFDIEAMQPATVPGIGFGELGSGISEMSLSPFILGVSDLNSNLIIQDSMYFIAFSNEIVKLSLDGKLLLKIPLPSSKTSTSKLFFDNGNLLILNLGYATIGKLKYSYGKPYLASYDPVTGEEIFLKDLVSDKRDFVKDFQITSEELKVFQGDRVASYSLINGQRKYLKVLPINKSVKVVGIFNHDYVVWKNDDEGIFFNLDQQFTYMQTNADRVLELNSDYDLVEVKRNSEFCFLIHKYKELRIVSNKDYIYIINTDGEIITYFVDISSTRVSNDFLYFFTGSKLIELDLNQFID